MSIVKTHSIVVSTMPYRESSLLATLFTREYGRIGAIVKGIKRRESRNILFERGYEIEHLTYLKVGRELQLITECRIVEPFQKIRYSVEKTAIRDLIFEFLLISVKDSEPSSKMFDFLKEFLVTLCHFENNLERLTLYASRILFDLATLLGFEINFNQCRSCGKPSFECEDLFLDIEKGYLVCQRCFNGVTECQVPRSAIEYFYSSSYEKIDIDDINIFSLLHTAYKFCRYHFDIKKELSSFKFIESIYKNSRIGGYPPATLTSLSRSSNSGMRVS
ncbi:MAG: DNA repair protein RecO [Chitinispirillaceae bacterium]|nr:DNA repair protein RecO [Chitinispirillaceae bacterium]